MKNLKNAFWTSLLVSFVSTLASSVLPRLIWKSTYNASIIEGLKISFILFIGIFILAFVLTFITLTYRDYKDKKEEENKKKYKGYKKNKRK